MPTGKNTHARKDPFRDPFQSETTTTPTTSAALAVKRAEEPERFEPTRYGSFVLESHFVEGLGVARDTTINMTKPRRCHIDENGSPAYKERYESADPYHKNERRTTATVVLGNQVFIINMQGKIVYPT